MKNAKEIAQEALTMWEKDPEAWTQGTFGRRRSDGKSEQGQGILNKADTFCFLGGFLKAAGTTDVGMLPKNLLEEVTRCILEECQCEDIEAELEKYEEVCGLDPLADAIAEWNDEDGRSVEEVIEAIKCALPNL